MKKLICIVVVLILLVAFSTTAFAYTVTAIPETEGTGTVTGGGEYNSGTNATLTATPAEGYVFVGWYREGSPENIVSTQPELVYEQEEDRTYVARFAKNYTVALAAEPQDGGSVAQSGTEYALDAEVTVTATPNENYTFVGWFNTADPGGDPISTEPTYSFNIQDDMQLTARFSATYTLELKASPEDAGSVSGGGSYSGGTAVSVHATPADNYRFAGWYDISAPSKIISTDADYNINMDNNRTMVALFERSYGYTFLWVLIWIGIGFAVFVVVMRTIRHIRIVRRRRRRRRNRRY